MSEPNYKGFVEAVFEGWPEPYGSELDEVDLQDMGWRFGILERTRRLVPCDDEYCACAEVAEVGKHTDCYKVVRDD